MSMRSGQIAVTLLSRYFLIAQLEGLLDIPSIMSLCRLSVCLFREYSSIQV